VSFYSWQGQSSNNSLSSVPVAPHVRSTRKASSDHLALNIDMDSDKSTSDCEDDEKGFLDLIFILLKLLFSAHCAIQVQD
jgi:hypothetical protein